jgi:hypothetical protein
MWDAQTVYHYDPRNKAFNIYIAAILVRPFSREAYDTYCRMHESIDDVNQRLMLMWDSREFDRIGGYDQSYGRPSNMDEWEHPLYHVVNEKDDIEDLSPDFYSENETQQPGLTLKFKHDGDQVKSSASWPRHEPSLVVDMPERMGVCGEEFVKFTEAHPEFKEMRFYTDPTEWEEADEEYTAEEDHKVPVLEYSKNLLENILNDCNWDRKKAAAIMGISERVLYRRMKQLGLTQNQD